jgi:hypothetical protein
LVKPIDDGPAIVPKSSQKRLSHNEAGNEASGALQDEAVDIERETADQGNQAIEHTEPDEGSVRSEAAEAFEIVRRIPR